MKKEFQPWSGTLTVDNVDHIAELLRKLFAGKIYTCTRICGSSAKIFFEERLSDKVDEPVCARFSSKKKNAALHIVSNRETWIFSTNLFGNEYDADFYSPYFSFQKEGVIITRE
jgi:hypothetical protein